MGNSSSKDERKNSRPSSIRNANEQAGPSQSSPSHQPTPGERLAGRIYGARNNGNASARASRNDLSFLHLGRARDRDDESAQPDRPRETKQEREARRAERERQARLKERERSMREEGVDGGYLVTVGVYTGPEDFSKQTVRQFQIERRLAPFWKGLNDHNESWTEAQLVAAARGLPIPAADEVPPEMARTGSQNSSNPRESDANINTLTVPIGGRSQSYQSDRSGLLSASHPAFSNSSGPSSPTSPTSTSSQLFRGRAKTLASLATGNKSQSPDLTPQEIRLPHDPFVNGQPLEAYLYKDASECPICFMYYPPYLNRTRCCDQAICSECFVQIKRPDPHPPEHEQPGQQRPPEEEAELLVSEVAACPFCVTPEFGVSYDPPPFRRGLAYAHQNPLNSPTSAMSSSTSLATGAGRRRATSLSTKDPKVITTDMVRPDWAKKLADARAHALRRSAAATALHNAAYVLGNQGDGQLRTGFAIGRRRRTLFVDTPNASGSATPQEGDSSRDLVGGRGSSRRGRVEDLEELMMMEAIRLSLAAEEERARKAEKEAAKDAKKKAKDAKKEEKKQEKLAKKNGGGSLYHVGTNESTSTWASTSMARSTSNLGTHPPIPEESLQGKGKQPVQDFAGFNPLSEPTSTLNRPASPGHATSNSLGDAQRHLEASRAHLGTAAAPNTTRTAHLREASNVSSAASSFIDSAPGSFRGGDSNVPSGAASGVDVAAASAPQIDGASSARSGTPPGAHSGESMFNFRSLAAMVDEDKAGADNSQHIEHASKAEEDVKEPSPTGSPRLQAAALPVTIDGNRARGDSGESSSSAPPPVYVEPASPTQAAPAYGEGDEITPVPTHTQQIHDPDVKEHHITEILTHGRETELR